MKVGEYTHKTNVYSNVIKSSQLITNDGEIVELSERSAELLAMDILNLSEKSKNSKSEIMKKINETTEFKQYIKDTCGDFYFNYYKRLKDILEPQHIIRFLYLCTYLDYENRLVISSCNKNIPIYENDLQGILMLGRTETYKTKIALIDSGLITVDSTNKNINVNPMYCKRGDITKNNKTSKIRMFNNGIRNIYEKSIPKEHKKLAVLIGILPYINMQFNTICKNINEEILDNVIPYSVKELCEVLEYSNVTTFKKNLLNMTVNEQPIICFTETKNATIMAVNPQIYYKGTRLEDLKWLIGIFGITVR